MTDNLYFIFIKPKSGVSGDDVKKVMDHALDWFRIRTNLWIVYTNSDADKWYSRLEKLVKPDGSVFVCKLDASNRQGWMTESFWEWFREHANK